MNLNDRAKKKNIRDFIKSPLFLFVILILILLALYANVRTFYNYYKIRQNINDLQKELQSLEHDKLESLDRLKYVISDEFIEEKARTELNMKKPGENVFIVKGGQEEKKNILEVEPGSRQILGNPLKWWYYFTHKNVSQ